MKILYDNLVFNSTIDALTENPDYLFNTALKGTRLSRVCRTVDDAAQTVLFDTGSANDVDSIAILGHNITSGATIKIQANATDAWTAPSVDQTMIYNSGPIVYQFGSTQSYRYWRLYIDDGSNPDDYIQLAYVFIGEALTMPGMARAKTINKKTNSAVQKSTTGQQYADKRLQYKSGAFSFPNVEDDKRNEVDEMFDEVEIARPFIMLVWEDDLDVEPAQYCAMTKELEWIQQDSWGLLWTLAIETEQCF